MVSNSFLSLWVKDFALGEIGMHRGLLRLAESPNHAEFYMAVDEAITYYKINGDRVVFNDIAASHRGHATTHFKKE